MLHLRWEKIRGVNWLVRCESGLTGYFGWLKIGNFMVKRIGELCLKS